MDLPDANVVERVLSRRQIPYNVPGSLSNKRRADLYKVKGEYQEEMIPIYIEEMAHFNFLTVKNRKDKDGDIYIEQIHTIEPSVFRPGDELVKLDGQVITEFTAENKLRLFSFEADATGRRVKTVTIKRTEGVENEAKETEIDVEVAIVTDMNSVKDKGHARRIQTRFILPRRQRLQPRHQTRNVQWVVPKSDRVEEVFIQTNTGKFLTVRNGSIVGEMMGEENQEDFVFQLVPMTAAYSRRTARFKPKVVVCCKIRWGSYWVKTRVGSDGEVEMELNDDDMDDHNTVFKRRVKSNGRYGTGFECLLYKNVYLQYNPRINEVDVKPYNPRIDIGATLKSVPVSTLFRVVQTTGMVRLSNTNLLSTNDRSPRFSENIDEFEDGKTTSCCFKCFGFFKKKSSHSVTNESLDSDPTFPSNDTASRLDTDDGTT
ncbi:uncharacterized protein LOC132550554 [Ylistrum balloti]|uniref:uncharacterized protein LOC132550554 n=1 Tax=Ylistrum balloti TaxID=509963 RepID=UPI002905CE29|nr:uncharacterized protein LOC132550554 [Ylistrum balloti]